MTLRDLLRAGRAGTVVAKQTSAGSDWLHKVTGRTPAEEKAPGEAAPRSGPADAAAGKGSERMREPASMNDIIRDASGHGYGKNAWRSD